MNCCVGIKNLCDMRSKVLFAASTQIEKTMNIVFPICVLAVSNVCGVFFPISRLSLHRGDMILIYIGVRSEVDTMVFHYMNNHG